MKFTLFFLLVSLTGCGHYQATVYGTTGKMYQAPSLCPAIIQCKQAGEADCYYETTHFSDGDYYGCKDVKQATQSTRAD